jgi:hypothetical protein
MRNIHLLPTDKPSRLTIIENKLMVSKFVNWEGKPEDWQEGDGINQNIYITSDEEIKEGDWLLSIFDGKIQYLDKCTEVDKTIDLAYNGNLIKWTSSKHCKKIILTTDQELINDGVQAIDDEFLEWFVKNPSCEFVEVKDWYSIFLSCCKSKEECHCNKKIIIIPTYIKNNNLQNTKTPVLNTPDVSDKVCKYVK